MKLPRDVECPTCHAKIDWPCHSRFQSYRARTHSTRWTAVGVASPSEDDRGADYQDGLKRDLNINRRAVVVVAS